MPFDANPFAALFNAWVLQAVTASRFLTNLYRSLKDDRQAAAAIRAGQPATERMERHGLQTELAASLVAFEQAHPDETEAEGAAWEDLIEGQAGQCLFFALQVAKAGKTAQGFLGQSTAANKSFTQALTSYRAAFPDEMVALGVERALRKSAERGAEAVAWSAEDLAEEERTRFRADAQAKFIAVLQEQAALVLGRLVPEEEMSFPPDVSPPEPCHAMSAAGAEEADPSGGRDLRQ